MRFEGRLKMSQSLNVRFATIPQVIARCFPAQPPHLPPRVNQTTSLCRASSSCRIGLLCGSCSLARRFLLAFLHAVRSPFRARLQIVVSFIFMFWFSYRGLAPHLHRAHAGHTQVSSSNGGQRSSLISDFLPRRVWPISLG